MSSTSKVKKNMSKPDHHVRRELCLTRAPYREGRKPTSVKVYTVNQESRYLLVQGVPTVGAKDELVKLFSSHGDLEEVRTLDDYPSDKFNEVYLINFKKIQSARFAKKRLDDWSFYGGVLHVCYAPEYETVQETREKLQERRRAVAAKIRQHNRDGTYSKIMGQIRPQASASTATIKTDNQFMPSQDIGPNDRTGHVTVMQNEAQRHITSYETSTLDLNSSHIHQHEITTYSQVHQSKNSSLGTLHQQDQSSLGRVNEVTNNSFGQLNPQPSWHDGISGCPNLQTQTTSTMSDTGLNLMQLPPPPRHLSTKINRQINNYENNRFARVPSAHSTFPPNFDARLDKPVDEYSLENNLGHEKLPEPVQVNESDGSEALEISVSKPGENVKGVKEKSNEMSPLRTDSVVIKNFSKKGPVPKFIPRQMQSKMKSAEKLQDTNTQQSRVNDNDEMSKELRRNAFTLREIQGPEDVVEAKRKEPELQIASVAKSVKEIRKHVSQFSDRSISEIPSKRKKIKES